jgi:aldehyde dehydrogenase (NAD+)
VLAALCERLEAEVAALGFGDPLDESTAIGPLVSERALERTTLALAGAAARGAHVLWPPGAQARAAALAEHGFYHPPALVVCEDPALELVREESFSPLLVIQPAAGLSSALELLRGPRPARASTLFSRSHTSQRAFLEAAQTRLVNLGEPAAGAHAAHDVEFYGRWQTIHDR